MYLPTTAGAIVAQHASMMFHVMVGLDPLGDFSSVDGLNYEVNAFEYKEMGRNHSAVSLPFDGPGKVGEVTLKWGIIMRSKLFRWMESVKVGDDFLKTVYIFQLSRRRIPLRVYTLSGCWPLSWTASEFSQESSSLQTEEVKLMCDQVRMINLSAAAMAAGELLNFNFYGDNESVSLDVLERMASVVRDESTVLHRQTAFELPEFREIGAVEDGEYKFIFKGFDSYERVQNKVLHERDGTLNFEWVEPSPDYDADAADLGEGGGRITEGEGGEATNAELDRDYVAEEGEFVAERFGPDYEAVVGDWGDAVHLDRSYAAEVGTWGFYEEDE